MKIRIFLLSAILSSSSVYGAAINPPSSLQEGLEIYMNFDTNNKNDYDSYGSYTGGIIWGPTDQSTGEGFSESTGYNEWNSHPGTNSLPSLNISSQNFTVNFQFKLWQVANDQIALRIINNAGQDIQLKAIENEFHLSVKNSLSDSTSTVKIMNNSQVWNNSLWQSFTMTSSSTGLNFYLNGDVILSSSGALAKEHLNMFQLMSGENGANRANFKMDDFGLWNRTLTTEEIKFLATNTASATVPEPGTATLALLGLSSFLIRRRRSRNS